MTTARLTHAPQAQTHPSPLARLASAAGDLSFAAVFLLTWVAPDSWLALPLGAAMLAMLLEFVVIHSTAFMGNVSLGDGARNHRVRAILGLGAFYTLFVGAFSIGFRTWQPLIAFGALTLNRALGVLLDPLPTQAQELRIRKGWAAATMSYLAAVMLTTLLPVPALGIDAAVVAAAELPGGGLWVSQPQRVVAAGFLHFALCGLSEVFGHSWISDRSIPR